MEGKYEHLLSLKVDRVVSRKQSTSHFMSSDEYEAFLILEEDLEYNKMPPHLAEEWRFLPKSFGQIYLGETFSFYVCCTNDSVKELVKDVVVRVDLQLNNRVHFVGEERRETLDAKESVHQLLHYEVKEMGTNVLICTVTYKTETDESQSFRKYFRFQVDKPLDVKTKFYNAESDEVYLEALLQNLTNIPMSLEQVSLEPSAHFEVKQMNKVTLEEGEEQWVFGEINRFNPTEFRQYLFCLTPKQQVKADIQLLKSVTVIGKLDIIWTSGIGCKGHLQTSQLERMAPNYNDIRLTVERIPSRVGLKEKFEMSCRITNCCEYEMEPSLYFDNSAKDQSILWLGISGRNLGKLKPLSSIDFTLTAFPVKKGLLPVPGIRIHEVSLKNNYDFEEIAYVFVTEASSKFIH